MPPAIRVENLSKRYRLGTGGRTADSYRTLRETIVETAAGALRPLRGRGAGDAATATRAPREEFWALKDVSFEVQPGEVVGIIGRNGAGKSTLLKLLSRITEPTGGRVMLRGRVGSLLEVGTGFHPELTGRENVYLNGSILGMTRREIDRKFDEIVAFSEIEKFLDTPVKRYSSGMYVRLAFAVAAHLEPEILVVDEVLAVGDAAFQTKCMGKINQVSSQDRTVLFVSHNMAALQQVCRTGILLADGIVVGSGPIQAVVDQYIAGLHSPPAVESDLSQHPCRPKGQPAIIHGLTLRSTNGEPRTIFSPHDGFIADITLVPNRILREPRLALAIEDCQARRITTVASYFVDPGIGPITEPCVIRCSIPQLSLAAGRYMISVSIAEKYRGLLDSLECVANFEVNGDNGYGNGEPYHPVYGPVLTASRWERVG
jgi:lipopolysaccharide transport system ATP-binding protein